MKDFFELDGKFVSLMLIMSWFFFFKYKYYISFLESMRGARTRRQEWQRVRLMA